MSGQCATCARYGSPCPRCDRAAEDRADARAEDRAERMYGDRAEARYEAMVYGENRGDY